MRYLSKIKSRLVADDVAARLEHHDRALADITAALQTLQAAVPIAPEGQPNEIVQLQRRVDLLEQYLPELLGYWSSASGVQRRTQRQLDERAEGAERLAASIQELYERIEFVRREVMYELRYSTPPSDRPAGEPGAGTEPKVVDAERVEAVAGEHGLRLNLGCGHIPVDGYVNVDMRELPGVDVVAPLDRLPFESGQLAEVHSAHVLEHFAEQELRRRLLPYWFDLLQPGGTFRAVVPDGASMVAGHASGDISFEDLRSVLFGGQEYEGDFHMIMFSADLLVEMLSEAGFVDIEVEAVGRPNDICLELQVAGRRPA